MKNFGKILFCMVYLMSCSTAMVKEVSLGQGHKGYDLNCLGDERYCHERARTLCRGKYRIHHFYNEESFDYPFGRKASKIMRLECLELSAQVLKTCSQAGINCIF